MIFMLIWLQVLPEQGVRYHHIATFANETLCMQELKYASVMVNDKSETIECIGVNLDD